MIDSSAHHEKSWELLASETGRTLPVGHFKRGFGKKNQLIIPEILAWSDNPEEIERLGNRKEELYRQLVGEGGMTVLPGSRELLTALKEAGIPRAVGSSTSRTNLDAIFASTGLGEFFDVVVSAEDVTNGKPAPDVFLKASSASGCRPRAVRRFRRCAFWNRGGAARRHESRRSGDDQSPRTPQPCRSGGSIPR